MHKIKIITHFSAAHFLRGYKGKCENLHGHNWKVEVLASGELNSLGMVIDFSDLKKIVNQILGGLDHKNLNDLEYFGKYNPSSENIAKYIFEKINNKLDAGCRLEEIRVWETDSSCAIYSA